MKEALKALLRELKWGKLSSEDHTKIISTCFNVAYGVNPCCDRCPVCDCHTEIDEYVVQIIKLLTQAVIERTKASGLLNKERDELGKQCPWCGESGYYKHWVDGKRHYRLCKWCGVLQNMGEKSQQCTLIQCALDGRHRYWTVDPEKKKCVHCGGKMKKVTIPL